MSINDINFVGTFQDFLENNLVKENHELECVENYHCNRKSSPIFIIGKSYKVGKDSKGNLLIKDEIQASSETIAKFRFKRNFSYQ